MALRSPPFVKASPGGEHASQTPRAVALAVEPGEKVPNVAVDDLLERFPIGKRHKLIEIPTISRKGMPRVTTVDFKMFEPGRDGIGHKWRRLQEYSGDSGIVSGAQVCACRFET